MPSKIHSKLIAATAALALSTNLALAEPPLQVAPVTQPSALDAVGPAIFAILLRIAATYGRLASDVTYGAIESDAARGTVTLRDLKLSNVGTLEACEISLGQMTISGLSMWNVDAGSSRISANDLSISNNCFGPNAAMIGAATGQPDIPIQSLSLNMFGSVATGGQKMDLQIVSPKIARIQVSIDVPTISYPALFTQLTQTDSAIPPDDDVILESDELSEGDPFADDDASDTPEMIVRGALRNAHVTVQDLGVWAHVKPMIPPSALTPEAITSAIVVAPEGRAERDLQQQLAATMNAFIANPGPVSVEIRPDAPIAFDSHELTAPSDWIERFQPKFSNSRPTPQIKLIANPGDATDPKAMGLALAKGDGVPMDAARAIDLLIPLQEDGEVALALAALTADSDRLASYAHAQRAAAQGAEGAMIGLDRVEARLATADIMAAQLAANTALPDTAFADLDAIRDAALSYESGEAMPRSYALAWRLGSLAAATGDETARDLLARLNARFGNDSAWLTTRAEATQAANADWTGQDLATRLASTQ